MNGPTMVPCRVMQASTAAALLSIRFITLSCSPTMSSAYFAQSFFPVMKKVVLPESPYGVCTTRSRPSSFEAASSLSSFQDDAVPITLVTDGAPAPLVRGHDQLVAELAADLLGLLVEEHHHDHRRTAPLAQVRLHFGVAEQVVVDLLGRLELDVRLVLRREHPRVAAVPGVVVDDVLEVAHPAVDAEQVERGRPEEVDRLGVGSGGRPDLGDAVQLLVHRPNPSPDPI